MNSARAPLGFDVGQRDDQRSNSRVRVLRVLLWLVGLIGVGLAAQAGISTHVSRIRGIERGFPAPVAGADVPALGINVALEQYAEDELDNALTLIAEAGFVWVRQSFYWSQIEAASGDFEWTTSDRIISAASRHPEIRLVAVLEDTPPSPPIDPDRFASFARAFAARYGEHIDYYQIWDEPNLSAHWGGGPVNPTAYADLLARCAIAIRAADRSAVRAGEADAHIVLAGLAPTIETGPQNLSDVRYLDQLYQAGAAPYFDAVAGKPYGFDTGPGDRRATELVLNFSRLLLLRETMLGHGDGSKPLWASHWGWNALPPDWAGPPPVWGQTDETTQAARTIAALDRARTEWPWTGALILENFQPLGGNDDARWGFALVGQDGNPRPVYEAIAEWSASLAEGAPVGGYPASNTWATYEGSWRTGPVGADAGDAPAFATTAGGQRATFRFDGTAVALTVRRGPNRAYLYITVDGHPANSLPQDETGRSYLVLYDSTPTLATVPLATDLAPGPHTVEVVAEGSQGQWALVDWHVGPEPVRDSTSWRFGGLVLSAFAFAALLICDARRTNWTALAQSFLRMSRSTQGMLVTGLTGALWATAAATWGQTAGPLSVLRSGPSPGLTLWFTISLIMLPLLAVLFALRADLGLGFVAATAPFYQQTSGMLYQALSLPEVLVLLCAAGMVIRSRFPVARTHCSLGTDTSSKARPNPRAVVQWRFWSHLTSLDASVLLLMLAAVLSSLATIDKRSALFELRTIFLLPALYYGLLRAAHLDRRTSWHLLDGFILGGVGVAAIGIVQYALGQNIAFAEGGLPRLTSVYTSPNNVGLYLGRVWPLLAAVALWARSSRRRTLYRLALPPVTAALVLSFSRGWLLLALPAALLAMAWRKERRWRWAIAGLILAGALGMIPLLRVPRFASLLDSQQGSAFVRLKLWRSSLALIGEHPWLGVGPGNFEATYRTRFVLPSAWQEFNQGHPHNMYLDHWARLGLLGLLAGGAAQVAFWKHNLAVSRSHCGNAPFSAEQQETQVLNTGLAGSMAALLAHGLVDNTVFFLDLSLAFLLTLALAQSCRRIPHPRTRPSKGNSTRPNATSVVAETQGRRLKADDPTRDHSSPV